MKYYILATFVIVIVVVGLIPEAQTTVMKPGLQTINRFRACCRWCRSIGKVCVFIGSQCRCKKRGGQMA